MEKYRQMKPLFNIINNRYVFSIVVNQNFDLLFDKNWLCIVRQFNYKKFSAVKLIVALDMMKSLIADVHY